MYKKPINAFALVLASVLSAPLAAQVRVQVAHLAPFANTADGTSVTVRVNGANAIQNFRYGDQTGGYVDLGPAGNFLIEVLPTGTTTVATSAQLTLAAGNYTVLAVGNVTQQPISLLALVDDIAAPPSGQFKLRIVHAAPFAATAQATSVSIRTDDGDVVAGLGSVPFGANSGFLSLPQATYDLKVATPNGAANLIDLAPVPLAAGSVLTVAAIGDGVNQPLGFIALPGGILPTEAAVGLRGNGHWYDPALSGQGFSLFTVRAQNRIVGTWYTFAASGGAPIWFTLDSSCPAGPGSNCGFDGTRANFIVRAFNGGSLGQPGGVQPSVAGSAVLTLSSCTMGTLAWTVGATSGTYQLSNLTPVAGCQ